MNAPRWLDWHRWLQRLDRNSWPRRLCRFLATPRPLTYAELVARAKAGGFFAQGYVYHTLGLVDCGDPEILLGLVKRSMKSEADKQRMYQLVSAIMADYVFALKFDEIVFNPYTGGGAGNLTPIQYIVQEFGEDFPAPVSADDLMDRSAEEETRDEVPPSPAVDAPQDGAPKRLDGTRRAPDRT